VTVVSFLEKLNLPPVPKLPPPVRPVALFEPTEGLVPVEPISGRLKVAPHYYRMGLQHAEDSVFLRSSVARQLVAAATSLPSGFELWVKDGWRSTDLQRAVHDHFRESLRGTDIDPGKYAFDLGSSAERDYPTVDPPHCTGGAVDLTLAGPDGIELWLGTTYDEPSEQSRTCALEEAGTNYEAMLGRRLLFHTMIAAGFSNYPQEWWHYDFGNPFWHHFGRIDLPVDLYRTVGGQNE
jgi:zinc D-Ala-D-Ala dipeptidase